ncbi:uncharacterized protein [Clytia hemisphaerica]|uniref:Uncharacterized protein n=1 Tax=Clytia hemisphaerica TaxID=252671 RepID=A0A7M5V4F8_9CNID
MYFNIDEESANVDSLTEKARQGFDNDTLVLVNSSCLPIEDSDANRKLSFWKKSARKIFAIEHEDNVQESNRELLSLIDSKLDNLNRSMETNRSLLAVVDKLKEAFKCVICREFVRGPAVAFSKCCKQQMGDVTCTGGGTAAGY